MRYRAGAQVQSALLSAPNDNVLNELARLSGIDVPVIDDWAMAPLTEPERRDFGEI
jgi:hypothetical protein